jgi:CMP-N,N'-diacetyllegionaminic acid synthase
MKYKAVALIPARAGSKRVPNKNIRILAGHPLLAYTVRSAIDSGVFDAVMCMTDSQEYAEIAIKYGATVPFLRPSEISGDKSPDIDWVSWALSRIESIGFKYEIFSILRPTSPFRLPKTIQNAWNQFTLDVKADSLRAVSRCKQHPGKMWVQRGDRILPLLPFCNGDVPWHSSQNSSLPLIYSQNSSLEIAWSNTVFSKRSIAGESVIPFISEGQEGFDINEPEDWALACEYIKTGQAELPAIK